MLRVGSPQEVFSLALVAQVVTFSLQVLTLRFLIFLYCLFISHLVFSLWSNTYICDNSSCYKLVPPFSYLLLHIKRRIFLYHEGSFLGLAKW
jgi:hypothetical protein